MSPFESLVPGSDSVPNPYSPTEPPPGGLTPAAPLPLVTATPPSAGPPDTSPPHLGPADAAVDAAGLTGLTAGVVPRGGRRRRGRRLVLPEQKPVPLTPQQRLLLLDTWQRSTTSASVPRGGED